MKIMAQNGYGELFVCDDITIDPPVWREPTDLEREESANAIDITPLIMEECNQILAEILAQWGS